MVSEYNQKILKLRHNNQFLDNILLQIMADNGLTNKKIGITTYSRKAEFDSNHYYTKQIGNMLKSHIKKPIDNFYLNLEG